MRKSIKLSAEQLAQISYSRAEKIMNISLKLLIVPLIAGICSLTVLDIILRALNPEGSIGGPPANVILEMFALFACIAVALLVILVFFISGLVAVLHRTPQNTHRLQPIMVNTITMSLPVLVTTFSIFVDYSSARGGVMLIMGFIFISSLIVTYPIYRHRLKADYKTLYYPR